MMSRTGRITFALLLGATLALGRENPEVSRAARLNDQVVEMYQSGRNEDALPLAKKALAICEKELGPKHPSTAASLNNLAALYKATGNYPTMLLDWRARATNQLIDSGLQKTYVYSPSFSKDGKWAAFHVSDGKSEVRRIFAIPVRQGYPKVEINDWIPITNGATLDTEAVWTEDGGAILFMSERDGFRCIWGQRLDPSTKRPRGEAYGVLHFHRFYRSLSSVPGTVAAIGLTAKANQLVFALGEITGNVWMQRDEASR